jgi:aspartyl protease family protein
MTDTPGSSRRFGTAMLILAWVAGLALTASWFAGVEERRRNPNQNPVSLRGEGGIEVILASNRQGHYLATGRINGNEVLFLLDTGATFVAVPARLADSLGLSRGAPSTVMTANGPTQSFSTRIDTLQLGDILLRGVEAGIVPGMTGDEVLLGMSALRRLEFSQRGGELILRQHRD